MDQAAYYRHLFNANIATDFAPSVRELSSYKLVLVPNLYLVSDVQVKVGAGVDLISGEKLKLQGLRLPAYGVAVIAE
jgi:beta-galactosidase GanA